LSASASSHRSLSSAAFITNIAESDFRHAQGGGQRHNEPYHGEHADFGKLIADETEKWGNVIRALNIKAE